MISEIDLDWPDEIRADVRRRLTRLERAVRHAPETIARMASVLLVMASTYAVNL